MGTIDLSAADDVVGGNTTRFLTKDNTWAVPAYTTDSGGTVTGVTGTAPISVTSSSTSPAVSISNMGAASAGSGGSAGAVPAPVAGDQVKFLRGDGTFATPSGSYTSWTISSDGVSGTNTVSDGQTATFSGGTKITTATVGRVTTFTHDAGSLTSNTNSTSLSSGSTFTAINTASIDGTGHLDTINTETYTLPSSDNYGSWTIQGDTGSSSVSSGETVDVAGGTNNTTSESGRTLTVNLDNSITLSGDLTVQGGDITTSAATTTFTIIDDEASALTFSSSGSANVLTLDTAATPGVGITGTLDVSGLSTLTGGFSAGAESAMGSNKITGLSDGTASDDAATLGQVQALVAGVGIFRGGYLSLIHI